MPSTMRSVWDDTPFDDQQVGARFAAYLRVSHEESAASGLSVDSQMGQIQNYRACLDVAGEWFPASYPTKLRSEMVTPQGMFVDEAVSAWTRRLYERPAGRLMRAMMRAGDHIIFWRLDRGFRSVYDFAQTIPIWLNSGINVHFVSQRFNLSTANGKLMANIIAAYAQWKSDVMSERQQLVSQARKARKENGLVPSIKRPPGEARAMWEPTPGLHLPPSLVTSLREALRIFTYARVSHVRSAESGLSIESQRAVGNAYCDYTMRRPEMAGMSRAAHFEDLAVSAFNIPFRKRPEGRKLDKELRSGDHVVFARLDRAFRDVRDMATTWREWDERGITVHFADQMTDTQSAAGRAFMQIMGVMAEWESADLSERSQLTHDQLKLMGRKRNPKGLRCFKIAILENGKKKFVPDERDIRITRWIVVMRKRYRMDWRQISDQIETKLAADEGRKMIPQTGTWRRAYPGWQKLRWLDQRQSALNMGRIHGAPDVVREWTDRRCQHSWQEWEVTRARLIRVGVHLGRVKA